MYDIKTPSQICNHITMLQDELKGNHGNNFIIYPPIFSYFDFFNYFNRSHLFLKVFASLDATEALECSHLDPRQA